MTRDTKPDKDARAGELEALYRAQVEVEPDSGLDRIVLARAEQALAARQQQRPRPWIAGLATAGALVLAVGIIVQQAPPPTQPETSPSAPTAGADVEPALRSAPASAPPAARVQSRSAPAPQIAAESAFVSSLADAEPELESSNQRLVQIRQLLASGEIDEAVDRLKALRTDNPQFEIPEELRHLLEDPPE
jgi:hypothetical protein